MGPVESESSALIHELSRHFSIKNNKKKTLHQMRGIQDTQPNSTKTLGKFERTAKKAKAKIKSDHERQKKSFILSSPVPLPQVKKKSKKSTKRNS